MSISILTQFNFLLHCIISLILGSAIGIEREYKQKPAGLKTHALICMGSAAITFLSLHIGEITGSAISDPARIAAQIVSGIGFIGAGTILQSRQIVQGLTTAASLWVVAAIGMLAGASMFIAATVLTMITIKN